MISTAQFSQANSALNRLIADVKFRVGEFLGNEKLLLDAMLRVEGLLGAGAPDVKANAQVLKAKGEALLKIQKGMEAEATTLLSEASTLKTKIESNPVYDFLKSSPTYWGTRQYELLAGVMKDVAALTPRAASISQRMLRQNKDVKTFTNEVRGTEKAAAGTGVLPKIQKIITSTVGTAASSLSEPLAKIIRPLAIAGVAGVLLYIFATRRPSRA